MWDRLFYSQKPFFNYLGMAYILGFAGFACLIVGVIADAVNRALGLESVSWFLTAIGLLVLGLWFWLEWVYIKRKK